MSERKKREREERELRKARGGGWMDGCGARVKGLVVTGKCDRQPDKKFHPPRK